MTSDGGAVASYWFRRQYLATAEEFLRLVVARRDNLAELAVIIESTRTDLVDSDVVDDDVVDYAIEQGGVIVRRVQVKSSRVPSRMIPLRYSDAAAIFKRMGTGAHEVVISTNKPLAKKLAKACAAPTRSDRGDEVLLGERLGGSEGVARKSRLSSTATCWNASPKWSATAMSSRR